MVKEESTDKECTDYSTTERSVADQLITEHYDTLTRIARAKRRRMDVSDTFATTEILHETYFKIGNIESWNSPEHFIRSAALAMRWIIVDHARKKLTDKQGNNPEKVPLDENESLMPEFTETPEQVVGISQLLEQLASSNPRWMRVVDARYFGGMTEKETAEVLGMSERTVRRDWREARDWMATQLQITH